MFFFSEIPRKSQSTTFTIGDRVLLKHDRKGVIRWIGTNKRKKPVYGIECDDWIVNGTDGTWHNKRYFTCKSGRAYLYEVFTSFFLPLASGGERVVKSRGKRV